MHAKLVRIKARNFLSYSSLDVEVPEGVVVIVGPNGAGKSSFVDALAYALTGSVVSRRAASKKDLLTFGASEGYVELEIETNNKKLEIRRTVSLRGNSRVQLKEGGSLIASGAHVVDRVLAQRLGFPSIKALREAVFVPQGKLTELIDLRPSELKSKVLELIGLKNKELVERGLREVISHYKGRAAFLQKALEEVRELEEELTKTQKELDEIKLSLPRLEERVNELRKEVEREHELLEALERVRTEYINLKERILRLKEEVSELQRKLDLYKEVSEEKLEKLRRQLKKAAELENELILIENELQKIITKKRYEERLKKLKREVTAIPAVEARIRVLKEELEDLQGTLLEIERKKAETATVVERVSKELKNTEKIFNRIKQILENRDVDEVEEELQEVEREVEKLTEERERVIRELKFVEAKIEEVKNILSLLEGRDSCPVCGSPLSADKRTSLIRKYKEELGRLGARLKELNRKKQMIEETLKKLEQRKELLRRKVDIVNAYLESVMTEDVVALELAVSALRRDLENSQRLLRDLEQREASIRRKMERKKEEIADAEGKLVELRKIEGEIRNLEDVLQRELADVDTTKLEYLKKTHSRIKRELEKMGDSKKLERDVERLEKMLREKLTIEAEIGSKMKMLEEEERRINSLAFDEKEYERVVERVRRLEEQLKREERELMKSEERLEMLVTVVKDLERKISAKRKEVDRLRAYDDFVKFLDEFRKIFGTRIIDMITESFRKTWEDSSNAILERFELNVSSIRIVEVVEGRQKGWVVRAVTSSGEEVDVGSLSGGERVGVALALKLGLAKLLSKGSLSVMILDEPTIYLDNERRYALRQILATSVGPALTQLLVVTHDREMMDIADMACSVRRGPRGSELSCSYP